MEIFGDLSELCQLNVGKAQQNAVDELNTPVFEKAHFNYDRLQHRSDLLDVTTSIEDPFNYKIKNELSSMNTVNINDADNIIIQEDSDVLSENKDITSMSATVSTDTEKLLNYIVISSQDISDNNSILPNNLEYNIYPNSNKVTPIFEDLICEDEYLPTVNKYSDIFFNSNSNTTPASNIKNENDCPENDEFIMLEMTPIGSPDLSKSASNYSYNSNSRLTVELNNNYSNPDSLDTPDVIETIDAIQNEKAFNILNFITEEDINTTQSVCAPFFSTVSAASCSIPNTKQTRKRKLKRSDYEDDEDYEPPQSLIKQTTGSIRKQSKSVISDLESEFKPARRGRPPKQYSSNVSESSGECNGKYREMRDKNNEASRKSRLKRKLKEVAQEGEAQDLEDRNIKLKAQVAELERTVTNFRTNLMQILLKK